MNSTPSRDVPSTRAASSSSTGTVWKNWRRKKMPNAVARFGSINAPMWSMPSPSQTLSPNHLTMRNTGIIVTWNGTISVAISVTKSAPRPRNRMRAKA